MKQKEEERWEGHQQGHGRGRGHGREEALIHECMSLAVSQFDCCSKTRHLVIAIIT